MGNLIEVPRSSRPYELLNAQQRAAVEHGEGPLLVVAGAGLGGGAGTAGAASSGTKGITTHIEMKLSFTSKRGSRRDR